MATLSTKGRAALPKSDFGMPGARKYPMPDDNSVTARLARLESPPMLIEGPDQQAAA